TQQVVALDVELVGRRIHFAKLSAGAVGERERRTAVIAPRFAILGGHHPPRLRHAGVGRRAAEIVDAQRISLPLGDALEANDDLTLLARPQREDSRAKHAVSHPLHQRGIALASHDLFIYTARFGRVHRLAGDELSIDRELEVAERRALRQREHVVRFADHRAAIDEPLVDLVAKHAIAQLDPDVAPRAYHLRAHREALDGRL